MASDSLRLKGVSFDGRKGFATLSFESLRGAGNLEAGLLRAIEHCESNTKKVHALLLIFPENRTVMSAQTCDEQELVLDRVLIQRLLALRPLLIGFAERSTSVLETCLLACCDLAYGLETAAFQASSSSSAGAASNESPETTASQLHTGNAATATATATAVEKEEESRPDILKEPKPDALVSVPGCLLQLLEKERLIAHLPADGRSLLLDAATAMHVGLLHEALPLEILSQNREKLVGQLLADPITTVAMRRWETSRRGSLAARPEVSSSTIFHPSSSSSSSAASIMGTAGASLAPSAKRRRLLWGFCACSPAPTAAVVATVESSSAGHPNSNCNNTAGDAESAGKGNLSGGTAGSRQGQGQGQGQGHHSATFVAGGICHGCGPEAVTLMLPPQPKARRLKQGATLKEKCEYVASAIFGDGPAPGKSFLEKIMLRTFSGPTEQRESFQIQSADLVLEQLQEVEARFQLDISEVETALKMSDAERVIREGAVVAAESAVETAHEVLMERKKELSDTNGRLREALRNVARLRKILEESDGHFNRWRIEQEKLESAQEEYYLPLKVGTLLGAKAKKATSAFIEALGSSSSSPGVLSSVFDRTLMEGLPGALCQRPDLRSSFDEAVLSGFEEQFNSRLADLEARRNEDLPAHEKRVQDVTQAQEAHKKVKEHQQTCMDKLVEAEEAVERSRGEVRQRLEESSALYVEVRRLAAHRAVVKAYLEDFRAGPFTTFCTLRDGSLVTEVAGGDQDVGRKWGDTPESSPIRQEDMQQADQS
mmetsp:Transcript_32502/g.69643  ORF Transcript_32502/g.69643 Transcript_32502/m.69643 type:complete len:772 (+) Transcript_32502:189-2504(+)